MSSGIYNPHVEWDYPVGHCGNDQFPMHAGGITWNCLLTTVGSQLSNADPSYFIEPSFLDNIIFVV
jgi:hypothetical protein